MEEHKHLRSKTSPNHFGSIELQKYSQFVKPRIDVCAPKVRTQTRGHKAIINDLDSLKPSPVIKFVPGEEVSLGTSFCTDDSPKSFVAAHALSQREHFQSISHVTPVSRCDI